MNRKLLAALFFTILLISSCNEKTKISETGNNHKIEKTENVGNDLIRVSYNQKVNGYQVNVLWKPKTLRYDNAIGPAILEFSNGEYEFTLTNNYFALPVKLTELRTDENKIVGIDKSQICIDYKEPTIGNETFNSIDVPFLFIDLNFDGNKELVLTKFKEGQRSGDSYDAYSFNNGELEPDLYQITSQKPYSEIDFLTKLNGENKELILYSSGGFCIGASQTYSLKDGQFELTKIIRMERDDDIEKCYELIYSVENGLEKMISKKEIINEKSILPTI